MNSIFLTGTAGSGKSQLTSILANTILENNKEVIVVNLDPGVNSARAIKKAAELGSELTV